MSEYERSRTMPATAEIVFDEVSDLGRLDDWLPRELHVRAEEPPAVTVHEDDTGQDSRGLFRAVPEQLRLEWGTRDDASYSGWLQVADSGAGGSEVTIHLSFFDEEHAPPAEEVHRSLDESLERLATQVGRQTDSPAG
ncbi:SRPBCC family protein [Streptosporangium sandarakinum]|uniref:SRPBCC family protein n=1 Tax=Streptosporangium sandarakinum TaxID=1260955 RepID=A0A852V9U3_9ACTN|nr:SRPBCC family protein [Streptosporangium sandarakinum]NYF44268.1 hypothetical protein [Streptosporangium sandarakinum]